MKTIVWFGFVLLGAGSVAGTVIYTSVQSKASLDCGVRYNTNGLVWEHEGDMVISVTRNGLIRKGQKNLSSRVRVRQDTTLEIPRVTHEDAGRFTCQADGKTHEYTLAVVSVSANPSGELTVGSSAKLQCQVHGLTPSPTVQWMRPDGAKAPGTASGTVELRSVALSDAGTWECVISPSGGTYSLKLDVKGQVVTPGTTTLTPPHLPKDDHKPSCTNCDTNPISKLQWWVWVAVGVGFLVIILLIIFVIVMCKKIRRKKRRLLKMKNRGPKQFCQCNRLTAAARPQQGDRYEKPPTLNMYPLLHE